jgi:uncharacterized membrane protein YeaQ/YmgE (transglycosylase-associated protein family)
MDFIGNLLASPFICIGWIIVGIVAGALARQIAGSPDSPWIWDLLLGLAGSFVGGIVASLLGINTDTGGGIGQVLLSLVVAVVGAIILIFIGRLFTRNR